MSNQSHKDKYSGTEPEKTKKLFVQCFKEQTDKQFIVDGTEWQFAEPGIGHSSDDSCGAAGAAPGDVAASASSSAASAPISLAASAQAVRFHN